MDACCKLILLALFLLGLCGCEFTLAADNSTIITTKLGDIQGVNQTNNNGKTYYRYSGIPFAKPPLGALRFQRPEDPEPWDGVRNGRKERHMCLQYTYVIGKVLIGDEDCLYLNVYIPELPGVGVGNKSVMVWIYGGAYVYGSDTRVVYGPGKLMDYDVILVTINYRLGVLGFLSTADNVIPGNYGLWDQVKALQWVQDNIAAFGGDPSKVTIFGESAGAGSVSLLYLSPLTKGLFSGVIAESGSSLCPWDIQEDPVQYAHTLASLVNCSTETNEELLLCLQNKTLHQILNAYLQFASFPTMVPLLFVPVLDSNATQSLLPTDPASLISNKMYNQVPLITGLTENEGGFFYIEWKYSGGLDMDTTFVTTQLDQVVRNITDLSEDVIPQATQLIYDYYFSDINLNSTRAIGTAMQELLSDALLNLGNQQLITLLPKGESDPSVYSYVLSYKGSQRLHKFIPWENIGVTHTDDLVYLFDLPIYRQLHHQDKTTSERMLTFWTTFAKTGNPNPASSDVIDITWERVTSNSTLDYLNIDTELSMQENFRNDRMQFWENCIMTLTPTSNGTCNAV